MALLHYSPKDVSVTIAGFIQIDGYVDGTFINISRDVQPFETMKAMDGNVARLYKKDSGYKFELTLAQSSGSNNLLSAMYNIDIATQIGKFPLFIKDARGSTTFMSLTTWIEDIPQVTFSNGMESRTWTFRCSQASLNIGGNAEQSAIESALSFSTQLLPLLNDFGVF